MKVKRVLFHGAEGVGWALDQDLSHARRFAARLGLSETRGPIMADVVHSVRWNSLLGAKAWLLRRKKRVLATMSNYMGSWDDRMESLRPTVTRWLAPSRSQQAVLMARGVEADYFPFYVDETVFRPGGRTRDELAQALSISPEAIRGRFLIGSFQRDSLGADLTKAKPQKGADILVDILSTLPDPHRWMLLLAGPRRHFVIEACKARGIPFTFVGDPPRSGEDDFQKNILDAQTMAKLYEIADLYVVTSRSEGGPKALLEAAYCGTPVLSTPVGMAADVLPAECVIGNEKDFAHALARRIEGGPGQAKAMDLRAAVVREFGFEATLDRWRATYARFED